MPEVFSLRLCFQFRNRYKWILRKAVGSVAGARFGGDHQLDIKSLWPSSDVCMWKKLQPFPTGVARQHECMLPSRLFIASANWIGSHNRIDECVTVGKWKTKLFVFAYDFTLLASIEQCLKHALHRFAAACVQTGMQ